MATHFTDEENEGSERLGGCLRLTVPEEEVRKGPRLTDMTLFKRSAESVPASLCPCNTSEPPQKQRTRLGIREGWWEEPGPPTGDQASGRQGVPYLRHIRQPFQNGADTLKVIWHSDVGDPVGVHDLHAAQLVVGRVDLSSQDLL